MSVCDGRMCVGGGSLAGECVWWAYVWENLFSV